MRVFAAPAVTPDSVTVNADNKVPGAVTEVNASTAESSASTQISTS